MAENNEPNENNQENQVPGEGAEYVNVVKAAELLVVHPGTVRKAISDKRLLSTRIYGRVVIARSEIERYRLETYPEGSSKRGRPPKPTP